MKKHLGYVGVCVLLLSAASAYGVSEEAIIQKALKFTVKISARVLIGLSGDEKTAGDEPYFGSGCVIDAQKGLVLTSKHVITESPVETHVIFSNLERVLAKRIYVDPQMDVAVIEFDPKKVNFKYIAAEFETSENVAPGYPVLSFGHPLGYEFSASRGIIASKKREKVGYGQFYQSDTIIGGGNSGGPLISLKSGRVLGINTYRTTSAGTPMSFSLVADDFLSLVKEIRSTGKIHSVKRGDLGANFTIVKDDRLKGYFGTVKPPSELYSKGMFSVTSVRRGGPSEKAGLLPMDLLYSVGNIVVTDENIAQANRYLDEHATKTIEIKVVRDNAIVPLHVEVEDMSRWQVKRYVLVTGVALHDVSPETRGYDVSDQEGVEVADILEDSPGIRGNIQRYDIIKMINRRKTNTLDDLWNIIDTIKDGEKVEVLHQRFNTGQYGDYLISRLEVIKPKMLNVDDPVPTN